MLTRLRDNWWALALRGIIALIFGVVALAWPRLTLAYLVILFGIYALVDGVFALVAAIRFRHDESRWMPLLILGLLGILIGVVALVHPVATLIVALYIIAFWAIATGLLEIVAAVQLRKFLKTEWLLIAVGVLSVLLGTLLIADPVAGLIASIWMIGAYALITGAMLVGVAWRLRSLAHDVTSTHPSRS